MSELYHEQAKRICFKGVATVKEVEWLASRLEKADKFEALSIPISFGNTSRGGLVEDKEEVEA